MQWSVLMAHRELQLLIAAKNPHFFRAPVKLVNVHVVTGRHNDHLGFEDVFGAMHVQLCLMSLPFRHADKAAGKHTGVVWRPVVDRG